MRPKAVNFTSSSIYKLMTFARDGKSPGAPFFSYIQEKKDEKLTGRPMQNEANANANQWGNLCESIAHGLIPELEYQLVSKVRYTHGDLPWSGMPDGIVTSPYERVGDIKCPFTLTSFMTVYNAGVDGLKKAKPEWYWQLCSNSKLTGLAECELILFMPKLSRIAEIKRESELKGFWFHKKSDNELPWTADNSEIPELFRIVFTPPKEDLDFMEERIKLAASLL